MGREAQLGPAALGEPVREGPRGAGWELWQQKGFWPRVFRRNDRECSVLREEDGSRWEAVRVLQLHSEDSSGQVAPL